MSGLCPRALWCAAVAAVALLGCAGSSSLDLSLDHSALGIDRMPGAGEYPDDPAVVLLDEGRVEMVGSGETATSQYTRHRVMKVFTAAGSRFANVAVSYSTGSRVESIEARTILPDGRTVALDPADVFDVSLYPNFVFYSDQRAKIFTMPAVEDGAVLEYRYRIIVRGRTYWHGWEFQSTVPTLQSRFTLVRPAEWEVKGSVEHIALTPRQNKAPMGFPASTEWEARDVPGIPIEPGMPPLNDVTGRLVLAPLGIRTWEDVAAWYFSLAESRMRGSRAIRDMADGITAGVVTEREKVRALYDWVRERIRYIAVEIGIGGFQPHGAEDVLTRRYGDCKDMTTVLCALASECGLTVRPVLISTRQNGTVDTSAPSPYQFNHAIAVWESAAGDTVWLDATDKACPFGGLPWYDQGRQVLVVGANGKASLRWTPRVHAASNRSEERWQARLDSNGGATVQGELLLLSAAALELRTVLDGRTAKERTQWLASQLAASVPGVVVDTMAISGMRATTDSLLLRFRFRTPQLAQRRNDALILRPGLFASSDLPVVFRPEHRRHPVRLNYATDAHFVLDLSLPAGWAFPAPNTRDSLVTPFGTSLWECTQVPGGLSFRSRFLLHDAEIPAEQYPKFQGFLDGARMVEGREVLISRAFQATTGGP